MKYWELLITLEGNNIILSSNSVSYFQIEHYISIFNKEKLSILKIIDNEIIVQLPR